MTRHTKKYHVHIYTHNATYTPPLHQGDWSIMVTALLEYLGLVSWNLGGLYMKIGVFVCLCIDTLVLLPKKWDTKETCIVHTSIGQNALVGWSDIYCNTELSFDCFKAGRQAGRQTGRQSIILLWFLKFILIKLMSLWPSLISQFLGEYSHSSTDIFLKNSQALKRASRHLLLTAEVQHNSIDLNF